MKKISKTKFLNLKNLLDKKNITYAVAAKIAGISEVTFTRKINGQSSWDWDEMVLLKNGLNLDKEAFLNIFFNNEVTEM